MPSRAEAAPALLYLPELSALPPECRLQGDEAHYLARVVRARPGERVRATDGAGLVVTFEVLESRPEVHLRRLSHETRPRPRTLVLSAGAPEGDRADWLVEKAAELGVSAFEPLDCERGGWKSLRADRLERLALAALRQSLGAWRLEIRAPQAFAGWVDGLPQGDVCFVAEPGGLAAGAARAPATGATRIAVGPSSGFSPSERKRLADSGFTPLALAATRLRTETAAVAAAAWWAGSEAALG